MKQTWPQYFSYCRRLCPKNLSFNILAATIPFYRAWQLGVPHRALMDQIEHQSSLDWRKPEERLKTISEFIVKYEVPSDKVAEKLLSYIVECERIVG